MPALPTGQCSHCGQTVPLRVGGEARDHRSNLPVDAGIRCPGAGKPAVGRAKLALLGGRTPALPFGLSFLCDLCSARTWLRGPHEHRATGNKCAGKLEANERTRNRSIDPGQIAALVSTWSLEAYANLDDSHRVPEWVRWAKIGQELAPGIPAEAWAEQLVNRLDLGDEEWARVLLADDPELLALFERVLERLIAPESTEGTGLPDVDSGASLSDSEPDEDESVVLPADLAAAEPELPQKTAANAAQEVEDEHARDIGRTRAVVRDRGSRRAPRGGDAGPAEGLEREGDVPVPGPAMDVRGPAPPGAAVHRDEDGDGRGGSVAREPDGHPGEGLRRLPGLTPRPVHLLATGWRMLNEAELLELAEDIRKNGQIEPTYLLDGEILDGRNRERACHVLGREARYEDLDRAQFLDVDGELDVERIAAWVIAKNDRRRHDTPQVRGWVIWTKLPALKAECRRRQLASRAPPGVRADERTEAPPSAEGDAPTPTPTPTNDRHAGEATARAAELAGMSRSSMERIAQVDRAIKDGRAVPELGEAIGSDQVPIRTAADVAQLPIEEQRRFLDSIDPRLVDERGRQRQLAVKAAKREALERRKQEQAREAAERLPSIEGIEFIEGRASDVLQTLEPGSFDLIETDSPWHFEQQANGAASAHFPTMPTNEIVADHLHLSALAARNAVLVVWVTSAHLEEWFHAAGGLLRQTKWKYKGYCGFLKVRRAPGTGHWMRGDLEIALLYVRGKPEVFNLIPSVRGIGAEINYNPKEYEHSEKPTEILIDHVTAWCPPNGRVLELYAGTGPGARAVYKVGGGRTYRGVELEPERITIAKAKLAAFVRDQEAIVRAAAATPLPLGL